MVKVEQLEQSLLSTGEYKKCSKYYTTYNIPQRMGVNHGNPPPCWKMGEALSPGEISITNDLLEDVLRKANLLPNHDTHRCGNGHYPGLPFTP